MTVAKRKGRPPKSEKGPATVNLTMRLRPEVYEEIRSDAGTNGRSISAEAEARMSRPDVHEVARVIGSVLRSIEEREGKTCGEDEMVRIQCRSAVEAVANALLGFPVDQEKLRYILERNKWRYDRISQRLRNGEDVDSLAANLEPNDTPTSVAETFKILNMLEQHEKGQKSAEDIQGAAKQDSKK